MRPLTRTQRRVLNFVIGSIQATGRPPTLVEISDHFGWTSNNAANGPLAALVKRGFLTHHPHSARGYLPVCTPEPLAPIRRGDVVHLEAEGPIVLSRHQARSLGLALLTLADEDAPLG